MSFTLPVGPLGPILGTELCQSAPVSDRSPAGLAGDARGRKDFPRTGPHKYEWVSVHDPGSEYDLPLTGLSGTMISPEVSGIGNPFVHLFGNEDGVT